MNELRNGLSLLAFAGRRTSWAQSNHIDQLFGNEGSEGVEKRGLELCKVQLPVFVVQESRDNVEVKSIESFEV